jgi:hypothetical protein
VLNAQPISFGLNIVIIFGVEYGEVYEDVTVLT